MRRKIYSIVLLAAGLLIGTQGWAEKTLVAQMTALEQTTSFYMDETADEPNHVYASADGALTAALNALPDNSTPAKIKLFSDVSVGFSVTYLTIEQYQNVTIDLNNYTINSTATASSATQLILNQGSLTIEDNSQDKNGKITNLALNPDMSSIPGKGDYVIFNEGTFTLNSGTVESTSTGLATYVVENHWNSDGWKYSPSFVMNGGLVKHPNASAVRMYLNGTMYENSTNSVIINGGEINAAGYGVVVHYSTSSTIAPHVVFTVNGGKIKGSYAYAGMATAGTGNDMSNTYITINGGTLDGFIMVNSKYGDGVTRKGQEHLSISGGTFLKQPALTTTYVNTGVKFTEFITGGIFRNFSTEVKQASSYEAYDYCGRYESYRDYTDEERLEKWPKDKYNWVYGTGNNDGFLFFYPIESQYSRFKDDIKDNFIAEGYTATPYTEGNPETDLIISTLDKKDVEVGEGEKNLNEIVSDIKPDGTTEITIVPNTDEGKQTIINITEDTKVNKIEVTTDNGKGEAQIVVKDGVTLDVGNGGVVSENDILTTVLVESGGTLIIGTGGVDQEGNATPIEIKASEEKGTGTLIFSPSAKQEDTKKYAEVDLYTYCKKVNGKYTWQQFAIPVTGLTNEKVVKTPNKTSYVFKWDYATYGWSQLNNWAQLDEPFAGYDVTNVSENGGVVYTFKGDLIGNQNIQLTLPHKDYCVMGNSYTAPISIDALFEQISKEMDQSGEGTIEKTVYKYDAKAGYYVYTNELEQTLTKLGIMNAAFTDIKPMEGFLLNLQNGNTAGVMLNYANAVFTPATKSPAPASAPARKAATTDMTIAKMTINSANYIDRMTLVEGEEFSADIENGKDAYKYMNEDGINIYAFNNNDKLAMLASDNIESTNIAFQSAADDEYTLTFQNIINSNYELLDMQTGIRVPMIEGNVYTFYATPNTLNPSRFMVVSAHKMPTGSEQVKAVKNVKGIYTILGQYVGEVETWSSLPQGVYVVNGIKMVK